MPKPASVKAPALPDATKVKQAKGLAMRKKSDNIMAAETGRRLSDAIRVDWSKLAGIKGKGKGKGKGKKGKGKGEGKKYKKKEVSEDRSKAVERLEKKVAAARRVSLSEADKLDKSFLPKKPKFKKVKNIQPEAKGLNLMLKVVKCEKVEDEKTPTWEAQCGDDTGVVTFNLRSQEHADVCKAGASVRVQNAKVLMLKGYVKVVVDKWAVMKAADAALDCEVLMSNNLSATEYELTA